VVQKYIGYLGKDPKSKTEGNPRRIYQILEKIGMEYDAWPITKIIIENDLKLKKIFLKLK